MLRQSEVMIGEKKDELMGTEVILPFFMVLLIMLALFAASYSTAVSINRHGLLNSVLLGVCVGTVFVLAAILVGSPMFL